jgi:cyanate lyase
MMDSAQNVSRALGLALGVPSKTILSLQEEDFRDVAEATFPTPPLHVISYWSDARVLFLEI